MKGALQLAKVAGIPVRVHWSFGLLILWVVYAAINAGLDLQQILLSLAVVGAVFLCVILHEYGHALTARRFGVTTRDIILSPIGGIARLEFIPEKPIQEILIALAGPAVNLVIASLLLIIAMLFTPYWVDITSPMFWGLNYAQPILIIIAKINVILLIFNMLPAFPMDGGRVLRAALSIPFDRLTATRYAGVLGQAIGAFFVFAGLAELVLGRAIYIGTVRVSDLVLSIIGVFVFLAARREIGAVKVKHRLVSTSIGEISSDGFYTIEYDTPMSELKAPIPDHSGIVVLKDGLVTGILFREYQVEYEKNGREGQVVGEYTSPLFEIVSADRSVDDVLKTFQKRGYRLCPVGEDGKLTGIITRKKISEFVAEI